MSEEFLNGRVRLHLGDCREVLAQLAENSLDACVTDPPYHLTSIVKRFGADGAAPAKFGTDGAYVRASAGFMGRKWDGGDIAFQPDTWRAVYRVLKPGAHLIAFGGTRTYHRLVCAIEDAGFEVRDTIVWSFGSGFPKSHDVSKSIDRQGGESIGWFPVWLRQKREAVGLSRDDLAKHFLSRSGGQTGCIWNWEAGIRTPSAAQFNELCRLLGHPEISLQEAEREIIAQRNGVTKTFNIGATEVIGPRQPFTAPATDAARQWEGWGTALKPAVETILLCSKPVTVGQHFAIVLAEINARVSQCLRSDCDASDVINHLNDFQVRLLGEANSVLDGAKIRSLESIGVAPSAALAFTFSRPASFDQIRTKESSALSHVKPNGSMGETADQNIPCGVAADMSTRLLDMSMSASMGVDTLASIGSSWLHILDDLLQGANKFTIEMVLRLTTALKILNCLPPLSTSNGTGSLSPECELIVLARKPLSELTIAANVLRWGTGAINVDGCRIPIDAAVEDPRLSGNGDWSTDKMAQSAYGKFEGARVKLSGQGRWPANLIHDGSEEVVGAFPDAPGQQYATGPQYERNAQVYGKFAGVTPAEPRGDSGSAARFFYTAKADSLDRIGSKHPTVKPLDLMQYLVRLITPPRGTVIDPFAGTGTTGEAAFREGMSAVLIEREEEYCADIRRRMALALAGPDERARESIKAKNLPRDDGPLFAPRDAAWAEMWAKPFDFSHEPIS